MNILPYKSYVIHSEKTSNEISQALLNQCSEIKYGLSRADKSKPLVGWCKNNKFKFRRAISYRNSFLPIAVGTISNIKEGSIIEIRLRMNLFVICLMVYWLGFAFTVTVLALQKSGFADATIPFCLFVFGYLLMQVCFTCRAKRLHRCWQRCTPR